MRRKILKKVDEIEEKHCKDCTILQDADDYTKHQYCISKCPVGEKISSLGNQLLKLSRQKGNEILAKGEHMTTSDVRYLLNKGYTQLDIGNAMGLTEQERIDFFAELRKRRRQVNSIRQRVFDLLSKEELTPIELAEKLNINESTARNYHSQYVVRNGRGSQ